MILNSKFDVLRGWPREGAIDDTFAVHVTAGTPDSLPLGTVVAVQADGTVAAATTPALGGADALPVWVVVEGNADFSSQFLQKVVCLRGNAELQLDPTNFNAGAYPPGTLVSFTAGKFKVAAAGDQVIADVLKDNTATDGTIVIYFRADYIAKH